MKKFLLVPAIVLFASCAMDPHAEFSGRAMDVSKYQVHGATAEYDTPPVLLVARMPEYPLVARIHHELAEVTVHFVVGPDGRAHQIRVDKKAPNSLAYAATQALTQWRWKPARKKGTDVSASLSFTIDFLRSG